HLEIDRAVRVWLDAYILDTDVEDARQHLQVTASAIAGMVNEDSLGVVGRTGCAFGIGNKTFAQKPLRRDAIPILVRRAIPNANGRALRDQLITGGRRVEVVEQLAEGVVDRQLHVAAIRRLPGSGVVGTRQREGLD